MESAIEPTNVSNVAGVSLSLAQNYSMMIEAWLCWGLVETFFWSWVSVFVLLPLGIGTIYAEIDL